MPSVATGPHALIASINGTITATGQRLNSILAFNINADIHYSHFLLLDSVM
tara:strand:+ start:131202 stop:131354 length:153 start_codon:yes stop_codon:yes gene_type:complete